MSFTLNKVKADKDDIILR